MAKLYNLQGLRFIAFMLIFMNHSFFLVTKDKLFDFGARGVEIFFVLSGFLIAYNYSGKILDSDLKSSFLYMIRKVKKFYFLHIFTFLVFFLNIGKKFLTDDSYAGNIHQFWIDSFLNVTLLKSWYYPSAFSMNGATWFLSSIIFAYFMVPKIVTFFKHKSVGYIGLSFLLLLIFKFITDTLGFTVFPHINNFELNFTLYINPVYRSIDFLLGYLGYLMLKDIHFNLSRVKISAVQLIIICMYFFACIVFDKLWLPAPYILLTVLLIYVLTIPNGICDRLFGNKLFVHLGNISFELYILHQTLLIFIPKISHDLMKLNGFIVIAVVFIITVVMSELFHYKFNNIFYRK